MQKTYAKLLLPIENARGKKFPDAALKELARECEALPETVLSAAAQRIAALPVHYLPNAQEVMHVVSTVRAEMAPRSAGKPAYVLREEQAKERRSLVDVAMREFSAKPDAVRAIAEGWWEGRCGLKHWAESMASAQAQAATTPPGCRYGLPTQALVPDFYIQGIEINQRRREELSRLIHDAHRTGRVNITLPAWARDALIYMHTMRAAAYGTTTTAPRPQHPAQAVKQHPAQAVKQQMEGAGE